MEDFRVDVIVGKGPGATAIPLRCRRSPWSAPRPAPACCRGRCATGSGSPRSSSSTRPQSSSCPAPLGRPARRAADAEGGAEIAGRSRARRASPTGCCAGCATMPRSRPTASSTREVATRALGALRGRRPAAWTGSTARCSTPCVAASAGARSALSTLAVAVGEERETVEEVAEPFLVRAGCWPVRRGAGSRPRPPGSTSGWRLRATRWAHPRCSRTTRFPRPAPRLPSSRGSSGRGG